MTKALAIRFIDLLILLVLLIMIVVLPVALNRTTFYFFYASKQYLVAAFALLVVMLSIVRSLIAREIVIVRTFLHVPFVAFIFAIAASTVWSIMPAESVWGRGDYFVFSLVFGTSLFILYYALLIYVYNARRIQLATDFITIVGFFTSLQYILYATNKLGFLGRLLPSVSNTVDGSVVVFGIWTTVGLLITIGQLLKRNFSRLRTVLYGCVAVIQAVVLFSIPTQSIHLLALIGVVAWILAGMMLVPKVRASVLTLLFIITALIVTLSLFWPLRLPFGESLAPSAALDAKTSWTISWSETRSDVKHFLLGSGLGMFPETFTRFRPQALNANASLWALRFTQSGNELATILAEGGVLVVGCWLALVIALLWAIIKASFTEVRLSTPLSESIAYPNFIIMPLLPAWLVLTLSSALLSWGPVVWWLWIVLSALLVSAAAPYSSKYERITLMTATQPRAQIAFSFALSALAIVAISVSVQLGIYFHAEQSYAHALTEKTFIDAHRDLQEAINCRPHYEVYHSTLSQADWLEVTRRAQTNTAAAPNETAALIHEAIDEAQAATRIFPENVSAWENQAAVYENVATVLPQARDWAIAAVEHVRDLDATDPTVWWRLGTNYAMAAKWPAATAAFQRAIALKDDYPAAYIGLASVYEATNQIDLAISTYQTLLPTNEPHVYFELGRLLYNRNAGGDRDNAEQLWLVATQIDPQYADALYALGQLYESRSQVDQALAVYRRVQQLNPSNEALNNEIQTLENPPPSSTK